MTELCINCVNCAHYEKEWEYCFQLGIHVPETGCCENYCEKPPREK